MSPKELAKQRRQVREELNYHFKSAGYVFGAFPLILKQRMTPKKAIAIGILAIYAIGITVGGLLLYGLVYAGVMEG